MPDAFCRDAKISKMPRLEPSWNYGLSNCWQKKGRRLSEGGGPLFSDRFPWRLWCGGVGGGKVGGQARFARDDRLLRDRTLPRCAGCSRPPARWRCAARRIMASCHFSLSLRRRSFLSAHASSNEAIKWSRVARLLSFARANSGAHAVFRFSSAAASRARSRCTRASPKQGLAAS